MNCVEANKIPITGFLQSIGIEPHKVSGNAYWYKSPLRRENTPSFKVDARLNVWFDHGLGQGGKLVDLGIALFQVDVAEFLTRLDSTKSFSFQKPEIVEPTHFEIRKTKALENRALLDYLNERAIESSIAKEYCHEVYYKIKDKNYFALGFENDSHGFEIRNKYFKGCLGIKDITTIKNDQSSQIILFEGFIDFLSALQLPVNLTKSSFVVLNSVNQVNKAVTQIKALGATETIAFFDNDDAGRSCLASLRECFPNTIDGSRLYEGYKDLNEMLMAFTKPAANRSLESSRPKSQLKKREGGIAFNDL